MASPGTYLSFKFFYDVKIVDNIFFFMRLLFTFLIVLTANVAQAQQPKLMLPTGHTQNIVDAAFSPDGKKVATASLDNTAKIWDVVSGILLVDLVGHSSYVTTLCFSRDGKTIITGSRDSTIKIWDVETGNIVHDFKGHGSGVTRVFISHDGSMICAITNSNTVKIWAAEDGFELSGFNGVDYGEFSADDNRILFIGGKNLTLWDPIVSIRRDSFPHSSDVNIAHFSPDGKYILTASDSVIKIWDDALTHLTAVIKIQQTKLTDAFFSPDGKRILSVSADSASTVWDAVTGKQISSFKFGNFSKFSPDGKEILSFSDGIGKLFDANTGKLVVSYNLESDYYRGILSPDGSKIIAHGSWVSGSLVPKIFDTRSGENSIQLKGHLSYINEPVFSSNKKMVAIARWEDGVNIFNPNTFKLLTTLKGHTKGILSVEYSPDQKNIVTASFDSSAIIWNAENGRKLNILQHAARVQHAYFSPDGKLILTKSDFQVNLWDAIKGALLLKVEVEDFIINANFSPDGSKFLVTSQNKTLEMWDVKERKLLMQLKYSDMVHAFFSPNGKVLLVVLHDGKAMLVNAENGNLIKDLQDGTGSFLFYMTAASFSPDGQKLVIAMSDGTTKIWNGVNGSFIARMKGHTSHIESAAFSPDSKTVVTGSWDNTAKIWDANNGALLGDLKEHTSTVSKISFSPDGKNIFTNSFDRTLKVWDANSKTLLYTFLAFDSSDYLIIDKDNHYDGTPGARKLVYYTCGSEIIELQQLKDKLWVPNLVERINKGETITAPKLSDLNICGLTPQVESIENKIGYQFKITPRRGGLGETILYVNGIETKKYSPSQLKKITEGYELLVQKNDLKQYFVSGKENTVTAKAYTKENDISSRGVGVTDDAVKEKTPPNLYAVFIGVSDYKGNELDLKYAAKDAGDISNAVSVSAVKLLGKEHVFLYNLNTSEKRDQLPEKKSIKDVFTDIGKKAIANDILMVFFAGHGVVQGEKKQFYFLTADASAATVSGTAVKEVGISTEELMDWMKPASIKAQKRILILDACNSGSAINQMVSIGKDQGYLAARNDDKAEEIKQIDKLNEKAGLYILAASASNQSAYEMGRYSQGLLTYSLLKAIKEHPEVLEQNKFLNVSGWFNEAVKIVTNIVKESNLRQEPQLITTANFNIGIVDKDVLTKIILPDEKALFAACSFQNNEDYDDLDISKAVNRQLNDISSRGDNGSISFMSSTDSPDAYILSGRYEAKDDELTVRINIRQSKDKIPKYKFEVKGKKGEVNALAESIVQKAIKLIETK